MQFGSAKSACGNYLAFQQIALCSLRPRAPQNSNPSINIRDAFDTLTYFGCAPRSHQEHEHINLKLNANDTTMKKATKMNDTTADRDAEIAMLMAMGSATVEEASQALNENDGNVDRAMEQLYDVKLQYKTSSSNAQPSHLQRHEDNCDDAISKPHTKSDGSPAPAQYTDAREGTGK